MLTISPLSGELVPMRVSNQQIRNIRAGGVDIGLEMTISGSAKGRVIGSHIVFHAVCTSFILTRSP